MAPITFSMVLIYGVFQTLFFGLVVVFNFSVAFFLLGVTSLKTETGPASET
jgi:hypothetical protein